MCQTTIISHNIVKLGTRSYKHSLEALAPNEYGIKQLRSLNRDLDSFYVFLYSQCNSITEHDYHVFGKQLISMLGALKMLYTSCKQMTKEASMSIEVEKLKKNYSALKELSNDIQNYKVKAPKDQEWSSLLSDASLALKNIAHD